MSNKWLHEILTWRNCVQNWIKKNFNCDQEDRGNEDLAEMLTQLETESHYLNRIITTTTTYSVACVRERTTEPHYLNRIIITTTTYSVACVHERTIPTERQPLVGESFYQLFLIEGCRVVWSSGQSSWLHIQRSEFDSHSHQIFWKVVGLERGPLILVSTIEELRVLEIKGIGSGLEIRK
jgi:hypothetical protein